MIFPPQPIWQAKMPSWVSLPMFRAGASLVARSGKFLCGLDPATGGPRWQVAVDPDDGIGTFLRALGDLCVTDRRPDPDHYTQLVAVREGGIVWRRDLGLVVASQQAVDVAAGVLFAVGTARAGDVLVAVDLATGQIKHQTSLSSGADALCRVGDRFVVLNRAGSPGLYWLGPDGAGKDPIEARRAHDLKVSAGRVLATLGDEQRNTTHVQARDATTMTELWSAPTAAPVCGLEGDAAVHVERAGEGWVPVLRDAATGRERWRGRPLAESPGSVQFSGSLVLFTRSTAMTAYLRGTGEVAGELALGRTALVDEGRLYLGGFRSLSCGRDE